MQDDFYADQMAERLQKVFSTLTSVLFWLFVAIFLTVFFGLVFWPEATNAYLKAVESYLASIFFFQELILIFLLLWLIVQGFSLLVSGIRLARKYYFYPKNSFTNRALVPIQTKETVAGRRNTRLHYVTITHPFNQKNFRFLIDPYSYEKLLIGDAVTVLWHPTQMNILYMTPHPLQQGM